MAARPQAVLSVLVLCLSLSSASRSLLQASAPLAAQEAVLSPASAQQPVLPIDPALAPGLAASAPLPEGVVSLAVKQNSNQIAAKDALAAAQATPVRKEQLNCSLVKRLNCGSAYVRVRFTLTSSAARLFGRFLQSEAQPPFYPAPSSAI